jgi:hypothetical protein
MGFLGGFLAALVTLALQLWTVVAFVRRLPELTPEEYKRISEGPATRPREERRR